MASVAELNCLRKQYYELLPIGGGLRQLTPGFYGIGCPHPAIECLIAQLNKLLMHLGCSLILGLQMQASLEYLIIELGMSYQPLEVDYERFGGMDTHCWLKTLWEKCQKYGVVVKVWKGDFVLPWRKIKGG